MDRESERVARRLRCIAEAIGVPIERFFEVGPSASPAELKDLVRLWHRLRTSAARRAALDALERIVDGEELRPGPR